MLIEATITKSVTTKIQLCIFLLDGIFTKITCSINVDTNIDTQLVVLMGLQRAVSLTSPYQAYPNPYIGLNTPYTSCHSY